MTLNMHNYKSLIIIAICGVFILACDTGTLDKKEITNEELRTREHFTTIKGTEIKEGPYEKKDLNGQLIETSNYKNGELDGEQKLYEKGHLYSIAHYKNGQIDGEYQSFYENGEVYVSGLYENGVMNGKWKTYYETGQLKEIVYFEDNEENGPFVEFHSNGNLKAEGEYLNGDNEHGLLLLYDPNGILIQKMNCDRGVCRTIWKKEGKQGFPEDIRNSSK